MVIGSGRPLKGEEKYVMGFPRPRKRSAKRKHSAAELATTVAAICSVAVLATPAFSRQGARAQPVSEHTRPGHQYRPAAVLM